jgi:hypothetical protein
MAKAQKAVGYSSKENIYTKIGVTPIINAPAAIRPPADRASDFNATLRELDSRMDLFAADSTNAFVQVYRRK